jgi:hypothetical protein
VNKIGPSVWVIIIILGMSYIYLTVGYILMIIEKFRNRRRKK